MLRSSELAWAGAVRKRLLWLVFLAGSLAVAAGAAGQDEEGMAVPGYGTDETPGIEERLGETIPLDLTFVNETGREVTLRECLKRPTILTLVYLRCPAICSPLMHELAATVDKLDLEAGKDFDILTVSFDVADKPELAATAKRNLLDGMQKKIPEASWTFLTGEAEEIVKLTRAAGFRFRRDRQDFVHAGTLIFLSPQGKIVRYLPGLTLLPANVKLALLDAAEGTPRSFMQKLERLCYAYDSEGKTYVFQVNRLVLLVSVVFVAGFLGFLLLRRKGRPAQSGGS